MSQQQIYPQFYHPSSGPQTHTPIQTQTAAGPVAAPVSQPYGYTYAPQLSPVGLVPQSHQQHQQQPQQQQQHHQQIHGQPLSAAPLNAWQQHQQLPQAQQNYQQQPPLALYQQHQQSQQPVPTHPHPHPAYNYGHPQTHVPNGTGTAYTPPTQPYQVSGQVVYAAYPSAQNAPPQQQQQQQQQQHQQQQLHQLQLQQHHLASQGYNPAPSSYPHVSSHPPATAPLSQPAYVSSYPIAGPPSPSQQQQQQQQQQPVLLYQTNHSSHPTHQQPQPQPYQLQQTQPGYPQTQPQLSAGPVYPSPHSGPAPSSSYNPYAPQPSNPSWPSPNSHPVPASQPAGAVPVPVPSSAEPTKGGPLFPIQIPPELSILPSASNSVSKEPSVPASPSNRFPSQLAGSPSLSPTKRSRPLPPSLSSAPTRPLTASTPSTPTMPTTAGSMIPTSSFHGLPSPTKSGSLLGRTATLGSSAGRPLPPVFNAAPPSEADLTRSESMAGASKDKKRPLPTVPKGGILPSKSLDRGSAEVGKTAGGSRTSLNATAVLPRANTMPTVKEGTRNHLQQSAAAAVSVGKEGKEDALVKKLTEMSLVSTPTRPPVPMIIEPTDESADSKDDVPVGKEEISGKEKEVKRAEERQPTSSSFTPMPPPPRLPPPLILPDFVFSEDNVDPEPEKKVIEAETASVVSPSRPTVTFSSDAPPSPSRESANKNPPQELGGAGSGSGANSNASSNSGIAADSVVVKSSTAQAERGRGKRGIVCETCGEAILGRLVSGSEGTYWHPKCFRCTTCSLLLEHVSSYEHEGKIYCHLDYHELFTTRCYTCKTPIVDERFFTITDPSLGTPRYYHELHFFCSECGDPFLDPSRSSAAGAAGEGEGEDGEGGDLTGNINLFKGHPYCDKCHIRLHAPKCKKCRKPIAGEVLQALGGKWHAECLACESCERPFDNLRIFEHEGIGLCESCFGVLLRSDITTS